MKVVFYISSLSAGGAERVTVRLAHHLLNRGYEVAIITMHPEVLDFYPLDSRLRRVVLGLVGATRGLSKFTTNYHRYRALRRAIRTEKPDVVVAMMTTAIVLAILASRGLPVRVYGSERNYPGRKKVGLPWAVLRRFLYRYAAGHIAQTRKELTWLERHTNARNIHVIPNPVVWPIPTFSPVVAPRSVLPSKRKIILAVGTKPEQKGFDLLVRAFAGLAGAFPDWDLVILGIDAESESPFGGGASIKRLTEGLGKGGRVHFPGRVGNVVDWYQCADLFVLSSRYEGFPNVLLEAMASGCPAIAFDCETGPRDIIEDGVNGLLVAAESVEALTEAMECLIRDEKLRTRLRQKALAIGEAFSESGVMARWENALI